MFLSKSLLLLEMFCLRAKSFKLQWKDREEARCQSCVWCTALQGPAGPWAQWSVYWSTRVFSFPWNAQTGLYCTRLSLRGIPEFHILSRINVILWNQGSSRKTCSTLSRSWTASQAENDVSEQKGTRSGDHDRERERERGRQRQTVGVVCTYSDCVDGLWAITPNAAENAAHSAA